MSNQDVRRRIEALADLPAVKRAAAAREPYVRAAEAKLCADLALAEARGEEAAAEKARNARLAELEELNRLMREAKGQLPVLAYNLLELGAPSDRKVRDEMRRRIAELEERAECICCALPHYDAILRERSTAARGAATTAARAADALDEVDRRLREEIAKARMEAAA